MKKKTVWTISIVVLLALGIAAVQFPSEKLQSAVNAVLMATSATGSTPPTSPAGTGRPAGARGPTPVETAAVTKRTISNDLPAIGTLLADESAAISPETAGRISKIMFKDGESVETGAPLFQLDTDISNAEVADAEARLALAEANFRRSETLRQSGTVAKSAFDETSTQLNVARAALETAKTQQRKLTIVAPFSGVLGFRQASVGAYVTPGTNLVQLDKVDTLKVEFSVPELQQANVAAGGHVEVTADALPGQTFDAIIVALAPAIDVNGRSLKVRAALQNAGLILKPGLLARVTIKGPSREAVLVPEAAIVPKGQDSFVYVVTDKKAAEKKVQVGMRVDGQVEVTSGIDGNEQVIIAGNSRLNAGADVEVMPPAAEKP